MVYQYIQAYIGFSDIEYVITILDNQMEKNMGNEMETGVRKCFILFMGLHNLGLLFGRHHM